MHPQKEPKSMFSCRQELPHPGQGGDAPRWGPEAGEGGEVTSERGWGQVRTPGASRHPPPGRAAGSGIRDRREKAI